MIKRTGLDWWCDRAWIKFGCVLSGVMTCLIFIYWNEWDTGTKLMAAMAALIPFHVLEEWVFPGGLHYVMNFSFTSEQPRKLRMNRLSDMVTNLSVTIFYVILMVICLFSGSVPKSFLITAAMLSFVEIIGHTAVGYMMYRKFRDRGKTTIYAPGSFTAYWGFAILLPLLWFELPADDVTVQDWIIGFLLFLVQIVGGVFSPQIAFMNKEERFRFENNGYFDRFLERSDAR